jgi:hypothetical protein
VLATVRASARWMEKADSWLCATAYHGLAVSYRLPLVSGNYAPASSGPFSAARTGCGDVRAVLESSQAPLSGS